MLRLLHHTAVTFPVKQRRHLSHQMSAGFLFLLPVSQQIRHLSQFPHRPVVPGFRFVQRNIYDQDDLLPEVVKGNDLVKKHQIRVLKSFCIFYLASHRRLAVAQIVVGEISYQSSGEGRQVVEPGTFIMIQDLSEICRRVIRLHLNVSHLHLPVHTGDLLLRVVSKECISSPFVICHRRFQHIAVGRYIFQYPHGLDRCGEIRKDLTADGNHIVISLGRDPSDFIQIR